MKHIFKQRFARQRCPKCGKRRGGGLRFDSVAVARCTYCGGPAGSTLLPKGRYLDLPAQTPGERGAGKLAPDAPTVPVPSPANKT